MSAFAGTPTLPEERLVLWRTLFPLFRALARFLAPWTLEGAERIPERGGYILVSNHINWKDPPWIEFALGHAIRFMAKRELFQIPVMGFALRAIGAFPVRRGEADRAALQMALKVLEAGHPAGFFPEGHRSESGALIRGHPGIALIARRSNAVIVPIAVIGTPRARLGAFWRRDILLRVGEPFHAADLGVQMADAQGLADAIMRRVAEMLPPEMRGVYQDQVARAGDEEPTEREVVRELLLRWRSGSLDERAVHEAAERLWEKFGEEPPAYPKEDPRSIVLEVVSQLEVLNVQLITRDDIPALLEFLDSPVGSEGAAWARWTRYWDQLDFGRRLEELAANPYYAKTKAPSDSRE